MTKRPPRLTLEKPQMPLPAELGGHRDAIEKALQAPVLGGTWPAAQTFMDAEQPKAIAEVLVASLHRELLGASIAYLFREKMRRGGHVQLGSAGRAAAKLEYLTGLDFVIEFNWTAWGQLSPVQRIACVDHQLCHCSKDSDSGLYVLRHPDVAEFGEIVRRHGLWYPELRAFGMDVRSAQGDLFKMLSPEEVAEAQGTPDRAGGGAKA